MYRVVIVDDEPFMLEGMRLMIDWSGCGFILCAEASTAQEALHLIETLRPHLLITDVRMPGMLGTDLAAIMRRYHPEIILLFFSGYKDFAFAQSAIRSHAFGYLVKPIDSDEVHQTLRDIKAVLDTRSHHVQEVSERLPVLREQVLRRIATGDAGAESLLRAGVLLDLKQDDPCYCAVICVKEKPLSEGVQLLLTTCGGTPFLLSPYQCGLCFKQIERDLMLLSSLQERLLSGFDLNVQISVGRVGKGADGFAKSLWEALDATGVLFEQAGTLRLYHSADETASAWLTRVNLSQLVKSLEQDGPDKLDNRLEEMCRLARQEEPSLFALRFMAKSIETMLLLNLAQAGHIAQPSASLKALWENEAMSRESWLNAFCNEIRALRMQERGKGTYPPPVCAALDAIRKQYAEPLSTGSVAASLHMNPAYLGQLILRSTGQTFHELLLDTRISQACRLLRQTSRPVGEIAFAVGFRDVDYFSRQFRTRMAMSPNSYRGTAAVKEDSLC